eukprot:EC726604.1.p4 GENE.EC726604.1~~EC726604.1.p4  ORF type:complete len:58 (-),score=7.46 EC726604.1:15-188(-)
MRKATQSVSTCVGATDIYRIMEITNENSERHQLHLAALAMLALQFLVAHKLDEVNCF